MEKTTPSGSPLHRGRNGRKNRHDATMQRILPLCKGELEGVAKALTLGGWNLKSKI